MVGDEGGVVAAGGTSRGWVHRSATRLGDGRTASHDCTAIDSRDQNTNCPAGPTDRKACCHGHISVGSWFVVMEIVAAFDSSSRSAWPALPKRERIRTAEAVRLPSHGVKVNADCGPSA